MGIVTRDVTFVWGVSDGFPVLFPQSSSSLMSRGKEALICWMMLRRTVVVEGFMGCS